MPRKLPRSAKPSTLRKRSCLQLWGSVNSLLEAETFPCMPGEKVGEGTCTELGNIMANTINEMARRPCPAVSIEDVRTEVKAVLPHRRLVRVRNQLRLPRTVTPKEIKILFAEMRNIAAGQYKLRFNRRLNLWYISPLSKKETTEKFKGE